MTKDIEALVSEIARGGMSRRSALKRAAALGLSAPALAGLIRSGSALAQLTRP